VVALDPEDFEGIDIKGYLEQLGLLMEHRSEKNGYPIKFERVERHE